MTAREMQTYFERKVQLISPDLILKEKLTSDTIFAFLNAYTERYVRLNYLAEDQTTDNSRALKKNQDAIKGLLTRVLLNLDVKDESNTDKLSDRVELPDDYFLYVRSNSLISKNYKLEKEITNAQDYVITPNKTIKEEDVAKILSTYYNHIILLNPYVVLSNGNNEDITKKLYLNIIHDTYTTIKQVDLVYYRRPKKFNIIGADGINILDHCELPENVHMEIVEGAVEMFITEAKYRLNMRSDNNQ